MEKVKEVLIKINEALEKIAKVLPGLGAPYYSDEEREEIIKEVVGKAKEAQLRVEDLHDYVGKRINEKELI